MKQFSPRRLLNQVYGAVIRSRIDSYEGLDWQRSAIVFAPHPDDETLGCGGTIIRKKQADARVSIVFMTDGSQSHAHLMPPEQLKQRRAGEAIAATQKLGVSQDDLTFLDFRDGALSENFAQATHRVVAILNRLHPQEVFIPYRKDGVSDHDATNRIVLAALTVYDKPITVYEYPIWFWRHYPFTGLSRKPYETKLILKQSWLAGFGTQLLMQFRCAVYIGDCLEQKRAALKEHKTQMEQLFPGTEWQTLADVANGEFLACFFREYELFRCYSTADTGSNRSRNSLVEGGTPA
uniref:LmbE family protein n=1 Tax=Cyanothece sp. (strain PCC 7425 / ATCC 29141) TaxID=395961 RepID=B8HV69_CYAP4